MSKKLFKYLAFVYIFVSAVYADAEDSSNLKFNRLTTKNGLPSNDIQKVYQGRDGYIWIASMNGLYKYDGHTFYIYKSNLYNPELLSNNNILCITEDYENHMWVGAKGLNMIDKKSGTVYIIDKEEFSNNNISTLLVTKDNRLLAGTDRGLYQYMYDKDSCIAINEKTTDGVLPSAPIKTLIEDSRGQVWIGTWDRGLYRYDPEAKKYYSYPKMTTNNSAHVIFEDSKKQIWIGTWGEGLFLLENAYDNEKVTWISYTNQNNDHNSLAYNIIYDISEDTHNNTLWVGTRDGLSILKDEKTGYFVNYYPGDNDNTISTNEVNSIIRDNQGMMWLGLLGGGINTVITRKPYFRTYNFDQLKQKIGTNSISSLYVDNDGIFWLGVRNYGLVQYDRGKQLFKLYNEIDGFSTLDIMTSVMSITQISSKKQIWIGAYDTGIIAYEKRNKAGKITQYSPINTSWLAGGQVYDVYEDPLSNIWIGTERGLSMLASDNTYIRFNSIECDGRKLISSVIIDIEGGVKSDEIWIATNNNGVFRLNRSEKNVEDYTVKCYSISNKKLNTINASCIHKDKKERIWIGSDGSGLNLFDRESDTFISVHKDWNLPGDVVSSILEDDNGNLWLGSNVGLVRLTVKDDLSGITYRHFTVADGLCDNSFNRKVAFIGNDGEMFFGGPQGINSFYPEQIEDNSSFFPSIVITDIKTHNRSWIGLDNKTRYKISELAPGYTEKIKLDYQSNNFSIEFASLGYENPEQQMYAYKLDGFDNDWRYTNSSGRYAHYTNLKHGSYIFTLKATNENGVWSDQIKTLQVEILPPPWKTWWAYLIYAITVISIVIFVHRMLVNRIKLKNKLHIQELENAKVEEINHSKLQFFTNITHELLTPLSIISASVDELKKDIPGYSSQFKVMYSNINRLVRLLQQILEFRKAESGNLKLKVSQGDITMFVANSVEGFRPLIKKKQISLSLECNPTTFNAYFDPDKLDKILYNLLSNASKYNRKNGSIRVELTRENDNTAILNVQDEGFGLSDEVQKTLFKRFYEGEYRKFNTIGTGIGLSLTKDLVILHGGDISVESEEEKGTKFTVKLPINRSAYDEDSIDDSFTISNDNSDDWLQEADDDLFTEEEDMDEDGQNSRYNLLIIEDNEDLLKLMVKLLSTEYNIKTATNGRTGLDIVKTENIDIVVSDIIMPEMDGIELCKEIKNNIESSHIPVIMLTSKMSDDDRINAYESGADAYINKPFNLSLLHARINNLLKAREHTSRNFKNQLVFESKELNYTTLDEEFLKKAIDCVHKNLDDPDYDQTQFIIDMGTSRSTLFRKMKSLTGMSYVSFIRNIRLKAACRIIEEKKQIRISELAYAVGFNDPRYFSTCFKKEFGMQPREYFEKYVQI